MRALTSALGSVAGTCLRLAPPPSGDRAPARPPSLRPAAARSVRGQGPRRVHFQETAAASQPPLRLGRGHVTRALPIGAPARLWRACAEDARRRRREGREAPPRGSRRGRMARGSRAARLRSVRRPGPQAPPRPARARGACAQMRPGAPRPPSPRGPSSPSPGGRWAARSCPRVADGRTWTCRLQARVRRRAREPAGRGPAGPELAQGRRTADDTAVATPSGT